MTPPSLTHDELDALLREMEQQAEEEERTGKLAPVYRQMRGYVNLLNDIFAPSSEDEHEDAVKAPVIARMMGVSVRTVWAHSHEYPFASQVNGYWYYSRRGCAKYLKRRAA